MPPILLLLLLLVIFFIFLPRIKNIDSGLSESAKFMISLSIHIQDRCDRIAAIKKQAHSTCCNRGLAGLMEMMAHDLFCLSYLCATVSWPNSPTNGYSSSRLLHYVDL